MGKINFTDKRSTNHIVNLSCYFINLLEILYLVIFFDFPTVIKRERKHLKQ